MDGGQWLEWEEMLSRLPGAVLGGFAAQSLDILRSQLRKDGVGRVELRASQVLSVLLVSVLLFTTCQPTHPFKLALPNPPSFPPLFLCSLNKYHLFLSMLLGNIILVCCFWSHSPRGTR